MILCFVVAQHVSVFEQDLCQLVEQMNELTFVHISGKIDYVKIDPYHSMTRTRFPHSRIDVEISRFRLWRWFFIDERYMLVVLYDRRSFPYSRHHDLSSVLIEISTRKKNPHWCLDTWYFVNENSSSLLSDIMRRYRGWMIFFFQSCMGFNRQKNQYYSSNISLDPYRILNSQLYPVRNTFCSFMWFLIWNSSDIICFHRKTRVFDGYFKHDWKEFFQKFSPNLSDTCHM